MRDEQESATFPPAASIVSDYLMYLVEQGRSGNTLNLYRRRLAVLAEWLWHRHRVLIEDASADQLAQWRTELTVQPQSVTTYMTAVRGFYRWMCRMQYLEEDPTWRIPIPRRRRGMPRPAPEELCWYAIDNAPHRIRPWLVLAAGQGARACEVAALDRPDIMEAAQVPSIRLTGKGNKVRIIPLSPWVMAELSAYGLPKRGCVFRRHDGRAGRNSAAMISHLANEYLEKIEVGFTFHQLRHRFGTVALAASGNNLRAVQDLLGHADLATTAVYTGYNNQDAIDAVYGAQPPAVRSVRASDPEA